MSDTQQVRLRRARVSVLPAALTRLRAVTTAYGTSASRSIRELRGHHPGHSLLHEIVDGRSIGNARGDHSADHRNQGQDRAVVGASGRIGHRHTGDDPYLHLSRRAPADHSQVLPILGLPSG